MLPLALFIRTENPWWLLGNFPMFGLLAAVWQWQNDRDRRWSR